MKKIILLLVICFSFKNYSQTTKPKLIIGIVVDQMRYEFLERYWNKFGNDGFKKLVNEGLLFKNIHYNYVPTYTAPGHASIFSGYCPSENGIVANEWFSKEENSNVYCVSDKNVKTIGSSSDAGKMSPKNLMIENFADHLKTNNSKSKIIGISLKDRASILPAGHKADAAYWYDGKTGNWITSSYYLQELPNWLKIFNDKKLSESYLNQNWTTLLPIDEYTESLKDDNKYEIVSEQFKGIPATFPYNLSLLKKIAGLKTLMATPFGNSFTKDMAMTAITAEELGKDSITDLLTLSFSSTDVIGHQFGPHSIEVEDAYLRLDKDLGEFLKFIDEKIGKKNVLIFLTADHGVADIPAYSKDQNKDAGNIDGDKLFKKLKKEIKTTFQDSILLAYNNQQLYLNTDLIKFKNIDEQKLFDFISNYYLKQEGIVSVFKATELNNPKDTACSFIKNGWKEKRSGDIILQLKPLWLDYKMYGTSHGSSYNYDTHVPLIWYGYNIIKSENNDVFTIIDIAPTLENIFNFSNLKNRKILPVLKN